MFRILPIILFLFINLESCAANSFLDYCESLEERIKQPKIAKELLFWFDEAFDDSLISYESDYYYGGRFVPGRFTYQNTFDWNLLGFEKRNGTIKLIKFNEIEKKSKTFAKVDSISIAERSRASILIQSKNFKNFGFKENNPAIRRVTDRLAIYCLDFDD